MPGATRYDYMNKPTESDRVGSSARLSQNHRVNNPPLYVAYAFRLLPRLLALAGILLGGAAESLLAQSNYATPYTFNTLAGSPGQTGTSDGNVTNALFTYPQGVAEDSSGNVYVADSGNYTIRKIDSSGVVSTLAGSAGLQGSTDGTGSTARFEAPTAIAVDAHENTYVIDSSNIRMISPAGVVTTLTSYYSNGFGLQGIAVDSSGDIYTTTSDDLVVEFTPSQQLTPKGTPLYYNQITLAGTSGSAGFVDSTGGSARFNNPNGIAVDSSGNIYVADSANNAIRMITSAGMVTTIAGQSGILGSNDYTGETYSYPQGYTYTYPEFNNPSGVAVDGSGNIYVTDKGNDTIRKITPTTIVSSGPTGSSSMTQYTVTTLAGLVLTPGSSNGSGSTARFRGPSGIAVDGNGVVYVADTANSTIRSSLGSAPVFITWAGSAGIAGSQDGTGTSAHFNSPQGIAVDGSGNAYVLDAGNYTIRKITPAGVVTTLAGSPGVQGSADGTGSSASFYYPSGITVDPSGNVYVTDQSHTANPYYPYGTTITYDIREITPAGVVTTLGTEPNPNAAEGYELYSGDYFGIAAAAGGNLFVTDVQNNIIGAFTPYFPPGAPSGAPPILNGSLLAGQSYQYSEGFGTNPSYSDGTGIAATFNNPTGIAVDTNNTVYVADTGNKTVRKIVPGGVVTTLAGSPGVAGSNDSIGTAAQFMGPYGIAVDTSFNVYVADRGNDTIRKITPAGAVSTLAGLPTVPGSVDGAGTAARFNLPSGVAVDANGTIYVADTGNNTIRRSYIQNAPTVTLGSVTNVTGTSAQINGTINPNNQSTTVGIVYGTSDYLNNQFL